jgi:hypothetical protein
MNLKKRLVIFLSTFIAVLSFSCNQEEKNKETIEPSSTVSEPIVTQPRKLADSSKLIGDWIRTDAPYEIKISEISGNGVMKVGYFNPRSINVSKASWSPANGAINIYIELRDVNYPGSNYNLTYFQGNDTLVGKYFQAVEGVTYDVGFSRKK